MDRRAFSRALQAAAKVAFGTSLLGCEAVITVEETEEDDSYGVQDPAETNDPGEDRPVYAERPVYEPDVPEVCEPPATAPGGDWTVFDAPTFACCVDFVGAIAPEDPEIAWANGAPNEQTQNCCRQILTSNYDAIWGGGPLPHPAPDEVISACCVSAHGNVACTPWGPPMPPAMGVESVSPADRRHRRTRGHGARLDLRSAARPLAPRVCVDDTLRAAAIATWRGRMINEYASSGVFDALAAHLELAGASEADIETVRGFAEEERTHGVLCGAVVEALGGEAVASLSQADAFPTHDDVAPLEAVLRNVLSIACLSETVAVSLIGAEREEMPEGELKALLTRIWADEIGHARFGWRLVSEAIPRLDAAARARLSDYLRVALRSLESHELAHLPDGRGFGRRGVALGLCSGTDARTLFYATVTRVILPRLEALGLQATRAWTERRRTASPAESVRALSA